MQQGFSLSGIDPTFDYVVSLLAPKKVKYTASQFESFEAMREDYNRWGVLTVNVNHSDHTIFGEPRINWLFRAWHDKRHITENVDFSPMGESIAAMAQQKDIVTLQGASAHDKLRWIALIDTEVNGQLEYLMRTGNFPIDQRQFATEYLRNKWGLDVSDFPRTLDSLEIIR